MRNLSIERKKSFVACLVSDKVYVEDPAGTLTIDGTPCRKLGEVKNGETQTFLISDAEQRIFIIQDMASKDWCFEVYPVPAGEADLFLTGKHKYAPHRGNPYRFDNNPSPIAAEARKKTGKRSAGVMIIAVVVGVIIGILPRVMSNLEPAKPKEFAAKGIAITLTSAFKNAKVDGFDLAYGSEDVAVYILKEDFASAEGFKDYTLKEYGALLCQANEIATPFTTADGLTSTAYSYTNDQTGETYRYILYIYKGSDAFWMVQFALPEEKLPEYSAQITEWASSVTFTN